MTHIVYAALALSCLAVTISLCAAYAARAGRRPTRERIEVAPFRHDPDVARAFILGASPSETTHPGDTPTSAERAARNIINRQNGLGL